MVSIGILAKQAGVSVQTLRHYDKLGLLPPTAITEAGYRLYSAEDGVRLELIRTLREVGFDLATIGRILQDKRNLRDTVALQLETLETQVQALKRRQVLLQAVADGQEDAVLPRLRRLSVLANFDKHERETFLAKQFGWQQDKGDQDVWNAAIFNLPETLNETKLEVWLELAELAADDSFQAALRRQWQPFEKVDEATMKAWSQTLQALMTRVHKAIERGEAPSSKASRALIERWTDGLAVTLGKQADAEFRCSLLRQLEATNDPRFGRYWQLVATLKDWTYDDTRARAYSWLLEGLSLTSAP